MKKALIFIFVVSLYLNATSQSTSSSHYQDHWQYYYGMYNSYSVGVGGLINHGTARNKSEVKSTTKAYYKYKKGEKQDIPNTKSEYSYINGHLKNYTYLKKDLVIREHQYTYNNAGFYTNYIQLKKGDLKYEENIIYNDSNKILKYELIKKGEPKSNYVCEYENRTRIAKKDSYKKSEANPNYTWVYDYYEDGKRKSTEYLKKGKLQKLYLYTCNDEGKESKDTVKTSMVCSLTEYNDDSSYVKIHRTTNSKGKVRKTRYTYSKDNKLLSYESITPKGVIQYKYTNKYDKNGNRVEYIYYRKGGEKAKYKEIVKYNSNNKVVEHLFFKGGSKMYKKYIKSWSDKGKLTEYIRYNGKNKLVSKTKYTYDTKDNVIKKVVYKQEEVTKEYNYTYDYI